MNKIDQTRRISNMRLLTHIGESTSKMLSFEDMLVTQHDTSGGKLERGTFRQPSLLVAHPLVQQEPMKPRKKVTQPIIPAEISISPIRRGVAKNLSSPSVLVGQTDISLPPLWIDVPSRGVPRSYTTTPVPKLRKETKWHREIVAVAPGCSFPLCGSKETLHAFQNDRVVHTECTSCESFLYCIDSASKVLCPTCRSISPVETSPSHDEMRRLGLGLTVEIALEQFQKWLRLSSFALTAEPSNKHVDVEQYCCIEYTL